MNLLENIQKTKLDLKYFERNTAPQKNIHRNNRKRRNRKTKNEDIFQKTPYNNRVT